MAAKGAQAKNYILNQILELFPGSFLVDGKELRIPYQEPSGLVQVKVALTAAKENVEPPEGYDDVEIPSSSDTPVDSNPKVMSTDELTRLEEACAKLGLI